VGRGFDEQIFGADKQVSGRQQSDQSPNEPRRSNMTDDLRKDLLAIVLEEAFGYDEARIRNWLAGRFDHNDWVTEGDISALQTANLIVDRIECRCGAAISAAN
jgi:hypothetical protein